MVSQRKYLLPALWLDFRCNEIFIVYGMARQMAYRLAD